MAFVATREQVSIDLDAEVESILRIGDRQRLGHHPAVVANLDLLGIEPQYG
jgi:hypothetical protein